MLLALRSITALFRLRVFRLCSYSKYSLAGFIGRTYKFRVSAPWRCRCRWGWLVADVSDLLRSPPWLSSVWMRHYQQRDVELTSVSRWSHGRFGDVPRCVPALS